MTLNDPRRNAFSESFEGYKMESKIGGDNFDVFGRQGGPWALYQRCDRGYCAQFNVFEVTDERAFSGSQSFHFQIVKKDIDAAIAAGANAIKNSLNLNIGPSDVFADGDIASVILHMYIPSATNTWINGLGGAPRILDIGSRWVASVAEIRVSNGGSNNTIDVNRKQFFSPNFTPPNIDADPPVSVPANQWFKLELRFKVGKLPEDKPGIYPAQEWAGPGQGAYDFDPEAPAWLQIILDDTVILEKTTTTRGGDFNDGTVIDRVQIGPTISGVPAEIFVDDVTVQGVATPFIAPQVL